MGRVEKYVNPSISPLWNVLVVENSDVLYFRKQIPTDSEMQTYVIVVIICISQSVSAMNQQFIG